jgi:hypothetical protein
VTEDEFIATGLAGELIRKTLGRSETTPINAWALLHSLVCTEAVRERGALKPQHDDQGQLVDTWLDTTGGQVHLGDLQRELAKITGPSAPPASQPSQRAAGRQRHEATELLMLAAGAYLDAYGVPSVKARLIERLQAVADEDGIEIQRSTVEKIVERALGLWRSDLRGPDPEN